MSHLHIENALLCTSVSSLWSSLRNFIWRKSYSRFFPIDCNLLYARLRYLNVRFAECRSILQIVPILFQKYNFGIGVVVGRGHAFYHYVFFYSWFLNSIYHYVGWLMESSKLFFVSKLNSITFYYLKIAYVIIWLCDKSRYLTSTELCARNVKSNVRSWL